jgi:hypothetical protein
MEDAGAVALFATKLVQIHNLGPCQRRRHQPSIMEFQKNDKRATQVAVYVSGVRLIAGQGVSVARVASPEIIVASLSEAAGRSSTATYAAQG